MKRTFLALLGVALVTGCAKFPDSPNGNVGARLTFTLVVDGKIRSGAEAGSSGLPYVYMVALRFSNDANPTTQGPIPVIAPPWGNGFVAGNATHYVWWNPLTSPRYGVFQFVDPLLNNSLLLGAPADFEEVATGAKRIKFTLQLNQLYPDQAAREALRSMQVNFLTMDRIPNGGTDKFWDALGDGRLPNEINDFILISLRQNGTYNNSRSGLIEPSGDVPDPDLDLVDWQIEVQLS